MRVQERTIVQLSFVGLDRHQVADVLQVRPETVKRHLRHALARTPMLEGALAVAREYQERAKAG